MGDGHNSPIGPLAVSPLGCGGCLAVVCTDCRDEQVCFGRVERTQERYVCPGVRCHGLLAIRCGPSDPCGPLGRPTAPFSATQSRGEGAGQGLATALGFVQQSGGRSEIASAVGRGATICMLLPVLKQGTADDASSAPVLRITGYHDGMAVDGPQPQAMDVPGKPYRRSALIDRAQAALRRGRERVRAVAHRISATSGREALRRRRPLRRRVRVKLS
jgi:hypothetical protein